MHKLFLILAKRIIYFRAYPELSRNCKFYSLGTETTVSLCLLAEKNKKKSSISEKYLTLFVHGEKSIQAYKSKVRFKKIPFRNRIYKRLSCSNPSSTGFVTCSREKHATM